MTTTERYQMAKTHVREQKDFWIHLALFLVANTGIVTFNLVRNPEKFWFHWVLMGWGAGLLLHGFQTFGGGIAMNWEKRKIKELVKQDEEKEAAQTKSSAT
jgi:hypothetical protein